jgi:hypothetical protein
LTPEDAVDITTIVWGIAAVAALSIAVPQAVLLIRLRRLHDRLWPFRVMSALLFGSLGVAMGRNVLAWADLAYFDQRYLGPIARRWPLDLAVAMLIMLACVWAALLYVRVQSEVQP